MLVILYVLFFALGAGPVTWLYLSEILPPSIKGKAAALATFLCWVGNLTVALSFYPMLQVCMVPQHCIALALAWLVWHGWHGWQCVFELSLLCLLCAS